MLKMLSHNKNLMMESKLVSEQTAVFILVMIWTYTGMEKLLDWKRSWNAFHNQTFPKELADIISYAVPISEILLALLLVFGMTRWWGLIGSLLLLTVFNTYVGLIWWGAFQRVPCNCAGFLESMGWAAHFWFNAGLIIIIVFVLFLNKKSEYMV